MSLFVFEETIFHGMLSFLLFAGGLQINIEDLKTAKLPIAITATRGPDILLNPDLLLRYL
ncbi:MAG: hypothetical protein ABI370_07630 [Gammaproteobacteria bacterium]